MDTFGAYLDGWYDVEIQLQMHLYNRNEEAFRQGNARKDQIGTIEQFEQWRSYVRESFVAGIGGLPETNCPLHRRRPRRSRESPANVGANVRSTSAL